MSKTFLTQRGAGSSRTHRFGVHLSGAFVDPDFDTADEIIQSFGRTSFEDRIQIEARYLKEDWQ